jgi:hypothetical protein
MFYMVWSGITKYIRQSVLNNLKPIEVQGLGVLSAQFDKPLERLTRQALERIEMNNLLVQLDLNQKFLDKLGENAAVLEQGSLINVFDPNIEGPASANIHGLT